MKMLTELIEKGYKSLIVPKGSKKTFFASKIAVDELKDDSDIETFKCESDYEVKVTKVFPKDTWIDLRKK